MPQDKDFKRVVRNRMSQTGERYTTARSAFKESSSNPADPKSATNDEIETADGPAVGLGSVDELLHYSALGIRAEHVRSYRSAIAGIKLEDLAGLWVMGVSPEKADLYAAQGLTREMMLIAATTGVSPEEAAEFAKLAAEREKE